MSRAKSQLPGTVRWARRLCFFVGGILALSTAGLALALLARPPRLAGRGPELMVTGVVFACSACGLIWAAVGTRDRSRSGWRAGIVSYVALVVVDVLAIGGGRRFGLNTVLMLLGLSTLLSTTTRRWFNTTDEELRAAEAEERSIRRARRRLTEEAPSLWDISFKDLPRRDQH